MFENTKKLLNGKSEKLKKILITTSAIIAIPATVMVYNTRNNRYISNTIDKSYGITLNPEIARKILDEKFKNGKIIDKTIFITTEAINNLTSKKIINKDFSNDEFIKDTLFDLDNNYWRNIISEKVKYEDIKKSKEKILEQNTNFFENNDSVLTSLSENYSELIEIRNKIIKKEELVNKFTEKFYFNLNKNIKTDFSNLYKSILNSQNLENEDLSVLKELAKFKYESVKLLFENYKDKFDDNELKTMNFFLSKYKDADYRTLIKSTDLYNKLSLNKLNLEEKDLISLIGVPSLRNKDLVLYGFKINLELKNNMTTNPELNQQVAKSSTPSMNNF